MNFVNEYNFINTPLLEEDTEMETPSDQATLDANYIEEIDLSLSLLQVQTKQNSRKPSFLLKHFKFGAYNAHLLKIRLGCRIWKKFYFSSN